MNKKTTMILLLLGIIIMLSLSMRMIKQDKELSCDKCEIEYKNKNVGQKEYSTSGKMSVIRLFEEYKNEGRCLVQWNKNQGFIVATSLIK